MALVIAQESRPRNEILVFRVFEERVGELCYELRWLQGYAYIRLPAVNL